VTSSTGPLRLLLLGGFEAWSDREPLRGFESQKVRALLAYLAMHRGKPLARDHLAGLFWGEKDPDAARRNLRQAIYNLKATLREEHAARPLLLVDGHAVTFSADAEAWIDVEAFEQAAGAGGESGRTGFHDLVGAAQLYRGDLLAGLLLKECPEFEEWLLTAQERLRELALDTLRTLIASYTSRGEYRLGIRHARRLVAMDPLSEEAHRDLLRLYELAGHRGRALAHYADLRDLLRRELGVEPLAETQALYESILADALRVEGAVSKPESLGPIVPLVGRSAAFDQLAECWQAVVEGGFQVTLLVGEEGIGKTRLVRSFLDAANARARFVVLTGQCREQPLQRRWAPLAEALRQGLPDDRDATEGALARLPRESREELSRLLPELAPAGVDGEATPPANGDALCEAVAELLDELSRANAGEGDATPSEPVVLFLDDLHWADAGTLAIVTGLPRWLPGSRVWLLGALDPAGLADDHPLRRLAARDGDGVVTALELERLGADAIAQIAASIVDARDAGAIAELLATASEGLPLTLVTLLNSMWDEGDLTVDAEGRGRFRGDAERWRQPARDGLDAALLRRVRRLPTSTRRLATIAAVIGQRFDTELLARAEDEHPAVVETGLGLLLERWLVRQHRERWNARGLESSLVLWSRGARRGAFQFDPPRLRAALYRELHPLRRQVLHRQTADALAALHAGRLDTVAEELAHHYLEACAWEPAREHLERAAARALAAGDPDGARACLGRAVQSIERLRQQAATDEARDRLQAEAARLEERLAALTAAPA
jgi:DNA-binding SARP family transcriptional activator